MASALGRLRRGVRRYGVKGAARRLVGIARETVYDRQSYVWYQLPLRQERPRRELDGALTLVEATRDQVPLLDALWAIDREEAYRRLDRGGTLWLVLEGETPAFSCWTFVERTPIRAAQGGWLELPGDTTCLEESLTSPDFRGRGVAPGAWTAIADRLESEPFRRMVTTVEEDNVPSRKAVEKIGFTEVGRMHTARTGRRVRVTIDGDGDDAAFLKRLARD